MRAIKGPQEIERIGQAPGFDPWPEGLPLAEVFNEPAGTFFPYPADQALAIAMVQWEAYPVRCQLALDSLKIVHEAELDVLNKALSSQRSKPPKPSILPWVLGIIGAGAVSFGVGVIVGAK